MFQFRGQTHIPPTVARLGKRLLVYPRYRYQLRRCRIGFAENGAAYQQPIIFVSGLLRSGTTWMQKLLTSYPGYDIVTIPGSVRHELATGRVWEYQLPANLFDDLQRALVVVKTHVAGSENNARVLETAAIRYAIMHRDPRDVAVSYYHYIRRTPWQPDCAVYSDLSLERGLLTFGERILPAFVEWVRSWDRNRSRELSLMLRYEDFLAQPRDAMRQLACHFGLPSSDEIIDRVLAGNSFQRLRSQQAKIMGKDEGFFRKGVAGDWRQSFTPAVRDLYKSVLGDFLIEYRYESSHDW